MSRLFNAARCTPHHSLSSGAGQAPHAARILIIRLDRIGDVVLSTPVIKAIRDACPGSHIAFMVRPDAYDIVRGNPYLNEVIVYDKAGKEKGFLGNLKFITELRQKRFDLAVILHPTLRTHWMSFLAGIPERVGYDKKCGFLLSVRIPHNKQLGLKHETEYSLDVTRYIGIDPAENTICVPSDEESEARIEYILRQNGIRPEDVFVVINPSASCPSKRWSAARFGEVADAISKRYGARIVFISGFADKEFAEKAISAMKSPALNLSGLTTIGDLVSLLKRARLFISNDSGPVHIACAVGTPVVAIFGRNDRGLSPARWGPRGERDVVLHKDVGCVKCLAHNCTRLFRCLEAITVDDVLAAADKIFRSGKRA